MAFQKLNKSQTTAVKHTEGPLLIIAGPGSGKTHTLVEKVLFLIKDKSVHPKNILISTFTEKAAAELITRISNRLLIENLPVNLNEMYIGTLHSICLSLLDENRELTRLKRSYSVIDQFEQSYFLFQQIGDFQNIENSTLILGDSKTHRWRQAQNLMSWVNKVSEEAIDVANLLKSKNEQVLVLAECYKMYEEKLAEENTIDFSSIQYETLKLFNENPDILAAYQQNIKYIMVDEYQDTNTIQESILLKIAEHHNNISVVGDDDQALYRFRGATVRNILEFPMHFKDTDFTEVRLSRNYRSHSGIIDFYKYWMDRDSWWHNEHCFRHDKEIVPRNIEFPDYKSVLKLTSNESEEDWCQRVSDFLFHLKNEKILSNWNQVAFLFRSVKHSSAQKLSEYLENVGIPVYSPRANLFFDREEVRLVVGALIFLFPQFEEVRQKYITRSLDIWGYYDDCLKEYYDKVKKPENKDLFEWCKRNRVIHQYLDSNTDYGFSGLFYELLQFPLFSQFLDVDLEGGIKDTRQARNLSLMSKLLTKYEHIYRLTVFTPKYMEKNLWDFFNHYFRFLREGGIGEYEDESEYAPSGCISFMTIHQSKGLEFPITIVDSLYSVPAKQYTDLDVILQNEHYRKPPFEPIEKTKFFDFWRLYYTAYSRAENLLMLTCFEKSGRWPVPSKYFRDYYDELPEWEDEKDNLNNMELSDIKEVNIKPTYSFTSDITVFENCSLQYKFFKDLEFTPVRTGAMMFGILVHETIEDIHKAALQGEQETITNENIESWFNLNYAFLSQKQREYLAPHTQKAALKQVQKYAKRHQDWSHLKEAEVDVSLVKEDYLLKGKIDLIKGDNNSVEIVDFKSEKKPDLERERDKIEHYKRQLEVYAHLVEERTGEKVSKLHLYYTGEDDGNPYLSFNKDTDSIEGTIKEFDKVVERIEKKDYNIHERPLKLCENCDMKNYCDMNC